MRSQSMAASMSPPVSVSAFLASIIPAPETSRSSLTIVAVIDITKIPSSSKIGTAAAEPGTGSATSSCQDQASAGPASSASVSSTGPSASSPMSTPAAPICAAIPSSAARAIRSQ